MWRQLEDVGPRQGPEHGKTLIPEESAERQGWHVECEGGLGPKRRQGSPGGGRDTPSLVRVPGLLQTMRSAEAGGPQGLQPTSGIG